MGSIESRTTMIPQNDEESLTTLEMASILIKADARIRHGLAFLNSNGK